MDGDGVEISFVICIGAVIWSNFSTFHRKHHPCVSKKCENNIQNKYCFFAGKTTLSSSQFLSFEFALTAQFFTIWSCPGADKLFLPCLMSYPNPVTLVVFRKGPVFSNFFRCDLTVRKTLVTSRFVSRLCLAQISRDYRVISA